MRIARLTLAALMLAVTASALALGDAVLYGDSRAASALTGLAEATGLPFAAAGFKRYAFGLLPIGDAFLLWSFTSVSPSGRTAYTEENAWPSLLWRLPWYAAGYLALLLAALATGLGRSRRPSLPVDRHREQQ